MRINSTVLHRPIAAFRVIPYFACKTIPIPASLLDIDIPRLKELMNMPDEDSDPVEENPDHPDNNSEAE